MLRPGPLVIPAFGALTLLARPTAPHATVAITGDGSLWTHDAEWTGALREHRFPAARAWTPETVVGYLRSTSFARPELFADRHEAFETEARQLLDVHAKDGVLREESVFT